MSKNLTRKGLAFGALVALGASVFAGAPAYAADSMVLAGDYTADATLATAHSETYTLNASLAPGSVAANISQLRYKVTNNGALDVVATPYTGATAGTAVTITSATGNAYVAVTGNSIVPSTTAKNNLTLSLTSGAAASTTQTVTVVAFLDSNSNGLVDTAETQTSQTVSFLKHSEITTSTTITAPKEADTTVTAVVKFTNINNQSLTAGRVGAYFTKGDGTALGSAMTVTNKALTSNVATLTVANDLIAGDNPVVALSAADAVFDGTVAAALTSASATSIVWAKTNANVTSATSGGTVTRATTDLRNVVLASGVTADSKFRGQTNVAFSATDGGFKFTTGLVSSLVKGSAVKVQPLLNATAAALTSVTEQVSTAKSSTIGSSASLEVSARVLGSFVGNTVKSTTATAAAADAASVTQDVALNSAKSVFFLAKDTATTPAAKAGQAVAVAVTTNATLSSTITLTVNGITYTSNAALPGATGVAKLALTTGSDGKATVSYTTAGYSTTNTVTFTATAENFTATVVGTERTRNFAGTGTPAVTDSTYIANHEGDVAVTTDGVAVPVNVVVQDQFGAAPADATYQVTATWNSGLAGYVAQATAPSTIASGTYAAVVGGKATLNLLDNGTGVGANTYLIELRPVAANGVLGTAEKTIAAVFKVNIVAAADAAPGEVALTGATTKSATTGIWTINTSNSGNETTTPGALTYSDFKAVDLRAIVGSAPTNKALNGTTDVTGIAIAGTVSSASTSTYASVAVPGAAVTVSAADAQFSVTHDGAAIYGVNSLTFPASGTGTFTVSVWSHKAGKNTITIKSGTGTATVDVYFAAAAELAATAVTVTPADGAAQFQAGRALDVVVKVADKFGNPVALDASWSATSDAKLTIAQTGSGYLSTSGDVVVTSTGSYATKLITNAGDLGTSTITATLNYFDSTLTDVVKTVSSEFGVTDADVTVGGRAVYASVEFAKGKTVTVTVDGRRLYSKLFSTDSYTELKFTQKTAGKHVVTVRVSGGIVYSETVVTTK